MKRVLILGAVLFFATAFSSFRAFSEPVKSEKAKLVFLVGSQTKFSLIWNQAITVWVTYNPANGTIIEVTAEDAWSSPITVISHNPTGISSSGQTIYADDFSVEIDWQGSSDYVICDGAFDMV